MNTDELTADVLTEANIFQYVRVCLGGNAREKRAEHFIKRKKYEFQNKRPGFQGRFYARLITNRLNQDDDRIRYAYEQIVQNELDDIDAFNNSLHPNQKQYDGLTRWEVLQQCQNPNTTKHPVHTAIQYLGYKTETSMRSAYVEVLYNKYSFADIEDMNKLVHNNVTAYYMPGDNGIERVYLYQDGKYIGECVRVERFQEAKAEQTSADIANAEKQWGYQKAFDGLLKRKRGQLSKVGVVPRVQHDSQTEDAIIIATEETATPKRRSRRKQTPLEAIGGDAIADI